MPKLLTILPLLIFLSCNKDEHKAVKLSRDSDTIYWKKVTERKNKLISQKNIEELDGKIFRFSIQNFITEIICEKSECTGKVILFTQKFDDEYGIRLEKEIFKKEYFLTDNQVSEIQTLYNKSQIGKLPSDKFIKNWNTNGLDGFTFIFETKEENNFTYKKYWSPEGQKEIPEAKKIHEFTKELFEIVEFDMIDKDFRKQIPFKNHWDFY